MEFYTIGVFNSSEEVFFNKLVENKIDTFCDIRQRRAVRGAKYAFVNSSKLQNKLHTLSIKYFYFKSLAPTAEIRELQNNADKESGETNTDRKYLGPAFISEYNNCILDTLDYNKFFLSLQEVKAKRIVLFCVEENANACHRSLASERISLLTNAPVHEL